ncbi:unnamed protein product [Candidula unifasciata]|uniref:Uncharacterized protein n=1 Tax=Candidula unifasciata TaxID=100452 RepID=A0A8S3YFL0_9EUPU|nr:unnamed protein product [Candidula unifasciata]
MSEEAIFVAIGIACVVAVLLFIVFTIYCTRQRRAREERHRRHLMRANIVQPPPYDSNRRNVIPINRAVIPFSPPPEYKELATPLATHRNPTRYGETNYVSPNGNSVTTGNSRTDNINHNNRNYINRNTITTTRNGHVSSITHIQPQNVATDGRDLMSRSSSSYSDNSQYSYKRNRQVSSVNERQRHAHTVITQELSAAALMRQQNANISLSVNTVSSAKPGDNRVHKSYSRNTANSFSNSTNNHNYNGLLSAGRNPHQTERNTASEVQADRSNSSRYVPSRITPTAQTPRNFRDVNFVTITPVHNSNRGLPTRDGATRQNTDYVSKSDRISGLKELSLI